MILRSVLLALLSLTVATPATQAAAFGDHLVPIHDASDGLRIVTKGNTTTVRFGPKAAKLYRSLAGKRALVACGHVGSAGAFSETSETFPRSRSRARLVAGGTDLCTISTRRVDDEPCMPPTSSQENRCARVNIAYTDAGRAHLDALARSVDLATVLVAWDPKRKPFGEEIAELVGPDDAPPAGKVGVWSEDEDIVISVLLRDGTRRFVSQRGGIFSTNDAAFFGPQEDAFGIF